MRLSSAGRSVFVIVFLSVATLVASAQLSTGGLKVASGPQALPLTSLRFEPNRGQARDGFRYIGRGPGFSLGLSAAGATFASAGGREWALSLAGADRNAQGAGEQRLAASSNYFAGSDPAQWRSGVENFSRVRFRNVYPGIDVVYYADADGRLEHDFVVAAGVDTAKIRWEAGGATASLQPNGDMNLVTSAGVIVMRKPLAYQESQGARRKVDIRYLSDGKGAITFAVGEYDRLLPLVIDPVLIFSRYIGGTKDDAPSSIVSDHSGNVFLIGTSSSTDFPLLNPLYTNLDTFVMKFNPAGVLLFSTFLGDAGGARGAVDSTGNLYLVGSAGQFFPTTPGSYKTTTQSNDFFVTKLSADGSRLIYSTFVGGSMYEEGYLGGVMGGPAIAVDADGNAYVEGVSFSNDFPVVNGNPHPAGTGLPGGHYAFRLNATGTALDWSTYLFNEGITVGVALDGNRNLIFAGIVGAVSEGSQMTATPGAFQTSKSGIHDAYVGKLSPTGSLIYLTFLGGTFSDDATGVAADAVGNAYVIGSAGLDFPVLNAYQSSCRYNIMCFDAFLTKINAAGSGLVFSTYFGGTGAAAGALGTSVAEGIRLDRDGNVWITGYTDTFDFPLSNAIQGACGPSASTPGTCSRDIFVAEFSATGSLLFSTYYGGSDDDYASDIAVTPSLDVYVAGRTTSAGFPLKGTASIYHGSSDAVLFKISAGASRAELVAAPTSYVFPDTWVGYSAQVQVTLGSSADQTVTISNITSNQAEFTILNNTCLNVPLATCTFTLKFIPASDGSKQATISVASNASTPLTIPVSGTGALRPVGQLMPLTLYFDPQAFQTTSTSQRAFLINSGTGPMTISAINITGDFAIAVTTCGTTLAASASCTIDVTFTPTAAGTRTGSLAAITNSLGSPHTISLTGTGVMATASTSPTTLSFTELLNSTGAAKAVTLTNTGGATMHLASLVASPGAFTISSTTCGATLVAGGNCKINVSYTATQITTVNGTLTIKHDGTNSPTTVSLTGSGLYPVPAITSITPTKVTVGATGITLTVNGTNFANGAVASVNGVPCSYTYVSSSQLLVSVPAIVLSYVVSGSVYVQNPGPGGGISNSGGLSVIANTLPEGALESAVSATDGSLTVPQFGALTASGWAGDPDDGAPVTSVKVSLYPQSDMPNPGIYVLATGQPRLFRMDPAGTLTTYGGGGVAAPGDNGPATLAIISPQGPAGMSCIGKDAAGNIFFADTNTNRIRKINAATGVLTTVAGTGIRNWGGESVQATSTPLLDPACVVVDAAGNFYFTEGNTRIRKVAAVTGLMTTFAGGTTAGDSGDYGPPTSAKFTHITALALDRAGNLYIGDNGTYKHVRRVTPAGDNIFTAAGNLSGTYSGDGGLATYAGMSSIGGIAVDTKDNIYVSDPAANRVRKFGVGGYINTIAGPGTAGSLGDGGPATAAYLNQPNGLSTDALGNIYIADTANNLIRKVDTTNGVISTVMSLSQAAQVTVVGNGTASSRIVNARLGMVRSDIAGSKGAAYTNSGWTRTFNIGALPPGSYRVVATAFDQSLASVESRSSGTITVVAGSGPFVQVADSLPFTTATQPHSVSATQPLTVTNTGTATLTIASIGVTGDFLQSNNCASLAPNASCTINVAFTPSATGGRTGTLTLRHNSAEATTTVVLTGNGTDHGLALLRPTRSLRSAAADQVITTGERGAADSGMAPSGPAYAPQPLDYKTPGLTASSSKLSFSADDPEHTITINNSSAAPVALSHIVVTDGFTESHTCSDSLDSGATCAVALRSDMPAHARTGTLKVISGEQTVLLVGLTAKIDAASER